MVAAITWERRLEDFFASNLSLSAPGQRIELLLLNSI